MIRTINITIVTAATALALGGAASAQHFDIYLSAENGKLTIGAADDESGQTVPGVSVFEAFFGESTDGNFPNETDEPGWFADDLPQNTVYGFNFLDGLRVFDGDFDQFAAETLTLTADSTDGGAPSATTAGAGQFVPGFFFTSPDGSGGFDSHIDFVLNAPASDGIYLAQMQATSDSFASSDPFWIVFSQNVPDEQLEIAVEYVEANIVPAPAGAAALLLAFGAGRRRRRN